MNCSIKQEAARLRAEAAAEERYDASQLARAIQEPLDDDAEDMGDYEGRQAECDLADALDDLPF